MPTVIRYIRQHWLGRQSLQRTWWLNCLLLSPIAVAISCIPSAFAWSGPASMPNWLVGSAGFTILSYLALSIWQVTGLWRAADHHMRCVGTILAGRAAQFAATIFMLGIALNLLIQTGRIGPMIPAVLGMAPYVTTLQSHARGRELEVRGGLRVGATQEIEQALLRQGNVRRLRLNLSAGSLQEARQLRQLVQRLRLDTYVTEICAGACMIAFEKGRRRYMQRSARLGIWRPKQLDIWFPDPIELKALGLVDTVYGRKFRFKQEHSPSD
jgi:hypothetical protein